MKALEEYKVWQKKYDNSVAAVGAIDTKGVFHPNDNHSCHAGLSSGSFCKGKEVEIVISGLQKPYRGDGVKKEVTRAFADWMLNKSPYAPALLNPSVDHVMENHWWLNPNVAGNLMVGAGIATRILSEFSPLARIWYRMVKLGIDPSVAFLLHPCYGGDENEVHMTSAGGHMALSYPTKKKADNFLSGEMDKPEEVWQTGRHYNRISALWGPDGYRSDEVSRIQPPSKQVKKTNIFQKVKAHSVFTTDEDIKFFVEEHMRGLT